MVCLLILLTVHVTKVTSRYFTELLFKLSTFKFNYRLKVARFTSTLHNRFPMCSKNSGKKLESWWLAGGASSPRYPTFARWGASLYSLPGPWLASGGPSVFHLVRATSQEHPTVRSDLCDQ